MHSKISNAATNALYGDVHGALSDIGQASHTAQDIVRHNFEQPIQHGWREADATRIPQKVDLLLRQLADPRLLFVHLITQEAL
jgi:hypothetical protein